MRKPKNIKSMEIKDDGSFWTDGGHYVFCDAISKPLRVTLDADFGIQDLEWILNRMRMIKKREG